MKCNKNLKFPRAALLLIAMTVQLAPGVGAATKYKTLHTFKGGQDGETPFAGLIFDQTGSLYGTTFGGGSGNYCCGTVFKLTPNPAGSWTESVLYRFCAVGSCADGNGPDGGLIFDQAGTLYGTTLQGGSQNRGTVYKLTPNPGGSWTESVLYNFDGQNDGNQPVSSLIFDPAGNLYGTTYSGGTTNSGTVFELTPNSDGSWSESVLYSFCPLGTCTNGMSVVAGLVMDAAGNLYGTTETGGNILKQCFPEGCGMVFQLTKNPDGSWTESALHTFTGAEDGANPMSGLLFDQAGSLYGTTTFGGANDLGTVYKLMQNLDGSWTEKVLYAFRLVDNDGNIPDAGVIFDGAGSLYGTTWAGGHLSDCSGLGCGVVFKLTPNPKGGWSEHILHRFLDRPGAKPKGRLIFDAAGNLFGTTEGDSNGATLGSVFEIMP
jgi:uncharacterized repeat protein (TIGR03803 family)